MATIVYGGTRTEAPAAQPEGDALWLGPQDLARASGWELKPEGLCRDEVCIPVPPDQSSALLRQQGNETWVNLSAFAHYLGQPYATDEGMWYFDATAPDYRSRLLSLDAPDFTLLGYDGKTYSLSDFQGKKRMLLLWASW
jgi:hypothetical protein